METNDMPSYTEDFKGFYDWKCTNCGKMFHQQFDLDTPQCPECFDSMGKEYKIPPIKPILLGQVPSYYNGKIVREPEIHLLSENDTQI